MGAVREPKERAFAFFGERTSPHVTILAHIELNTNAKKDKEKRGSLYSYNTNPLFNFFVLGFRHLPNRINKTYLACFLINPIK
jgi:hypothetical protein